MVLQICKGPACPRCSCTQIISRGNVTQWGQKLKRGQCGHCGKMFTIAAEREEIPTVYGAIIKRIKCPKCGSKRNRVYTTRKFRENITRYHKCRDCLGSFKSIEDL